MNILAHQQNSKINSLIQLLRTGRSMLFADPKTRPHLDIIIRIKTMR